MQRLLVAVAVLAALAAGGRAMWRPVLVGGAPGAVYADTHGDEGHGHDEGPDGHGHEEEHEPGVVELGEEAERTARIRVEVLRPQPFGGGLLATGAVTADQNRLAHIAPRIPSRIVRVHAQLGQRLEAGEALVELDSVQLGVAKADYLRLQGLLEVARTNYEREKRLYERGTSSQREMLAARAAFLSAEAERNAAREKLLLYGLRPADLDGLTWGSGAAISYFPLRAPFAGRVIEKHATAGEVVGPQRRLFTIADLSRVWVLVDIYERDLPRVHVGARARITGEGLDKPVEGELTYVSDIVDDETRTAKARIEVDNPEGRLRPGMFVRARLIDTRGGREALVVPEAAVQRMEGEPVVFVQTAPHRYERRPVQLGAREGDRVEVLAGLEAGERVVVSGSFWLKSELLRGELGEGHSH